MTFTGISPYLYYGDAGAAIEWLERVFGFGPRRTWGEDGRIDEADLGVGAQRISICGRAPGPTDGPGTLLIIHTDDVDAHYERVRAALEGELEVQPPRDEAYGPRTMNVTDPWGYKWYFWQGDADYPTGQTG